VAAIIAARQPPRVWHVVENLSSFERVARSCAADEGALWLPGYPPSWWQQAVATLLRHLPAPARIACDPDPDGIAIALQAGGLWSAAGLPWQPWRMGPAELLGLPIHRPSTSATASCWPASAPARRCRPSWRRWPKPCCSCPAKASRKATCSRRPGFRFPLARR
jgi:hypothetical protein